MYCMYVCMYVFTYLYIWNFWQPLLSLVVKATCTFCKISPSVFIKKVVLVLKAWRANNNRIFIFGSLSYHILLSSGHYLGQSTKLPVDKTYSPRDPKYRCLLRTHRCAVFSRSRLCRSGFIILIQEFVLQTWSVQRRLISDQRRKQLWMLGLTRGALCLHLQLNYLLLIQQM